MRFLNIWKYFFKFLLSPDYNHTESALLTRLLITFSIFVLKFISITAIGLLIGLLFGTVKLDSLNKAIIETSIFTAVFAGIYEELVFRLPLKKFNHWYLSFSLTGLAFIIIKKIYFNTMLLDNEGLLLSVILSALTFPIFFLVVKKYMESLAGFWEKHFGYVFYTFALVFALSHFFNAKHLELVNLKSNVTQFISALFFGFLRIRAGLIFAILVHIVWDLML
jgi:hypothetical protein